MRTERTTGRHPGRVVATGLAGLVVLAITGCATSVAGTPWPTGRGPAPPAGAAGSTAAGPTVATPPTRTVPPAPVDPGSAPVDAARDRPARTGTPPGPAPLTADVVADECLLDAGVLTGLLGAEPTVPAANAGTERADGSRSRSCFAVGGSSTVSVNVYLTHRVSPLRYVRDAAGARTLGGTGEGTTAALLDTVAGPTLQLGTAGHLVTVAVAGRTPTEEQWRAAARAAVVALPGG